MYFFATLANNPSVVEYHKAQKLVMQGRTTQKGVIDAHPEIYQNVQFNEDSKEYFALTNYSEF